MTLQTAEPRTPRTRRERRLTHTSAGRGSAEPSPFAPLPARAAVGRDSGIRRVAPHRGWLHAGALAVAVGALVAAAASITDTLIAG
ncbi:hypothetical protein KZC51_04085 [Microbacterium sp. SSW1-49]|uniref:Uncharacterized protein n=1 Tax=Microbacterium croceum TaxID=2851645 RepID=A0ABT0FB71_9MICO|nr:hypothetical protein [Microbacterium croceum]MCK2035308.1 hypothetical protein [Microbacterium croceum]